ncbi:MAG: AAA family ATPase [bacterium]|nr:AAA family ATPase [bacterium]
MAKPGRTPDVGRDAPTIIGMSEVFRAAMEKARCVSRPGAKTAATMPTILLTGETGTGKSLLARHVHAIGPLAQKPFVQVECAVLPGDLIAFALFGCEQSVAGNDRQARRGLLERASGGTLFLRNVDALSAEAQAALVPALEATRIRRIGGVGDVKVNVRVIAATNSDLQRRVAAETFRPDLFYRLNAIPIDLPPLRKRGDDVLLLAEHFADRLAREHRRKRVIFSQIVRDELTSHPWPGNVREVFHAVQRAILCQEKDGQIGVEHLGLVAPHALVSRSRTTALGLKHRRIRETLKRTKGNVSKAARILKVSRDSLRHRLEAMDKS